MASVEDEIFLRGPKKYPLIGNLLSMPSTLEWGRLRNGDKNTVRNESRLISTQIHLIACTDSDIIHVSAFGTSMIIVRSRHQPSPAGKYPLQANLRKSFLASIRPHMTMFQEL